MTSPQRPQVPQLSLPGYISWLPPLYIFLAKALQYQQDSVIYMDWADVRIAELEEHQEKPPELDDRPEVLLHPRDAEWLDSVWQRIRAVTGTSIERYTLDGAYWALSQAGFARVLAYSWKEKKMWVGDSYDCDDFALAFKSHFSEGWYPSGCNTVGFLVDNSSHHAYNLVIFEDGTWAIIEPGGDGDPNTGITWVDVTDKLGQVPYEFREGYLLL